MRAVARTQTGTTSGADRENGGENGVGNVLPERPEGCPEKVLRPEGVAELVAYLAKLPRRAAVDVAHLRRFSSRSF